MRIKRTVGEFNEGDFLGDAHDGVEFDDLTLLSDVRIRMDGATEVVQLAMKKQGIDKHYCNKLIVVLGIGFDGVINAMYAYDDRYLGVVSYKRKE